MSRNNFDFPGIQARRKHHVEGIEHKNISELECSEIGKNQIMQVRVNNAPKQRRFRLLCDLCYRFFKGIMQNNSCI